MPYNISTSNSEPLVTIADGTVDVNYTSLNLVGKNYPNYGLLLNQNFVYLLENFASSNEPTNPLIGQLWYDTASKNLRVRSSEGLWKSVGAVTVSSEMPPGPELGDQWWDVNSAQLKSWNGDYWSIIGPQFSTSQGLMGAQPLEVVDSTETTKTILGFYISGTVVSIWSNYDTTFSLVNTNRIPGFYSGTDPQIVRPGMTMADFGRGNFGPYTNVPKNMIWGTAEKALSIDDTSSFVLTVDTNAPQQVMGNIVFNKNIEHKSQLLTRHISTGSDAIYNIGTAQRRFGNLYVKSVFSDSFYFSDGTNFAQDKVGNLSALTTTIKANAVSSINETNSKIGNLASLSSTDKSTIVAAINSVLSEIGILSIPAGVVVMWSGVVSNIPSGWALCNGTKGTPDLRGKFVIGAGSSYVPSATGGSANATLVSHTHTSVVSDSGHRHFAAAGVDSNYSYPNFTVTASNQMSAGNGSTGGYERYILSGVANDADVARTSLSSTGISVTNSTVGDSQLNANLPPYYALCYIMKL